MRSSQHVLRREKRGAVHEPLADGPIVTVPQDVGLAVAVEVTGADDVPVERHGEQIVRRQDGVGHAAAVLRETLAGGAGHAAHLVPITLHQCEQDMVGLLGGQRGVDPVREGFHRLARRRRPYAVALAFVAPDPRKLALQLAAEPGAVRRKRGLLLRRPQRGARRRHGKLGR